LGLTQNAIHRLEHGNGTIPNLSRMLDFYHIKGYSIQWVMASDHSNLSMYRADKAPDQELLQALENLNKIINNKFS
jgi:hypothetical protein